MASAVRTATRQVRPILSINQKEARSRVLNLYKAWYRQMPYIVNEYDIPKNVKQCREKLREEFVKHSKVQDIRAIDQLVIRGQMELKEVVEIWKQKGTLMNYFKDTVEKKPTDFLSKFLSGIPCEIGKLHWQIFSQDKFEPKGLQIFFSTVLKEKRFLKTVKKDKNWNPFDANLTWGKILNQISDGEDQQTFVDFAWNYPFIDD